MDTASRVFRRPGWLLIPLAVAVAAAACDGDSARKPRSGPPSIVLVTVDTLRADRLGCYRHPTNRTPAIDRLATEGMLFEHAYCDVPWTTASMSSVMTGQYSSAHGVEFATNRLKPEAVTMAEILHDHGYQTGAIIGSFPLASVYGLNQGFEDYDEDFSLPMMAVEGAPVRHVGNVMPDTPEGQGAFIEEKWRNDAYRPDEDVTDAAIRWLEKKRDGRPFFLWVHYFGPHEKLRGDIGFVVQEPLIVAAYDGDVQKNDVAVGRFLDRLRALDLLDASLVILHADHGQNLGEHGVVGHGLRLDEASVRIPLLIRYPGRVAAGTRRADIGRNIDILPTVLDAAGIAGSGLAGRSLLPAVNGASIEALRAEDQEAFFRTLLPTLFHWPIEVAGLGTVLGPVSRAGVRTPQWKLVADRVTGDCVHGTHPDRDGYGAWYFPDTAPVDPAVCRGIRQSELFAADELDKGEHDVSREHPDVATALDALVGRGGGDSKGIAAEFKLSPEAEEKLKSLGYLR